MINSFPWKIIGGQGLIYFRVPSGSYKASETVRDKFEAGGNCSSRAAEKLCGGSSHKVSRKIRQSRERRTCSISGVCVVVSSGIVGNSK